MYSGKAMSSRPRSASPQMIWRGRCLLSLPLHSNPCQSACAVARGVSTEDVLYMTIESEHGEYPRRAPCNVTKKPMSVRDIDTSTDDESRALLFYAVNVLLRARLKP